MIAAMLARIWRLRPPRRYVGKHRAPGTGEVRYVGTVRLDGPVLPPAAGGAQSTDAVEVAEASEPAEVAEVAEVALAQGRTR